MSSYQGQAITLDCAHPGCEAALSNVDPRHVANLTAGGYWCDRHDTEEDE